jgi:hypothetical protein
VQGQKDAGQKFYQLISRYLRNIGLDRSISYHGVFIWKQESYEFFLALAMDDCLVICDNRSQFLDLKAKMEDMFEVTLQEGAILCFINLRIIQIPAGASIDQMYHIVETIVELYFKDRYSSTIMCIKSPFPTDSLFEQCLYEAPVLPGSALRDVEQKCSGSLFHWNGVLLYVALNTRIDISYDRMRITGYLVDLTTVIFEGLEHTMRYLHEYRHLSILYPRRPQNKKSLAMHWVKGITEYLSQQYGRILVHTADADHARDIGDRQSVTSSIHLLNSIVIAWKCKKQEMTTLHSTGS